MLQSLPFNNSCSTLFVAHVSSGKIIRSGLHGMNPVEIIYWIHDECCVFVLSFLSADLGQCWCSSLGCRLLDTYSMVHRGYCILILQGLLNRFQVPIELLCLVIIIENLAWAGLLNCQM
jgi:hypothetical protein